MDIFEEYKKENIDIENVINVLNEENKTNNKKNEGVIYTPSYIAEYIVENLNYNIEGTIIEPSVGHGIFIFKLIDYVEKKYNLSNIQLKNWFEEKVYCFDINKKNIKDLKILLNLFFSKKGINDICLNKIINADTLFYQFDFKFDFSFGNPPYIRAKNINEDYLKKIKGSYISCRKGNIDLYYAFMELMSNISDISCFIVPNSYISNKSAYELRKIIKNRVEKIIDFKNEIIFKDARTYTSIYKIQKENIDEIVYSNSLCGKKTKIEKVKLDDEMWNFNQKNHDKFFKNVEKLNIYSSIATLRDKIYIIDNVKEKLIDGKIYYEKKHEGQIFNIEKDACVSFYKLTKLRNDTKIIFPYDNNFKIIKEELIKEKYPNLYNYLNFVKDDLNKRDKGKTDKYENWFAYGRKQGIKNLKEDYFLMIPLMINEDTEFKIIKKNSFFLITSGFAIGLKDIEDSKYILDNFNEKFFTFVENNGKIWPGKKPYYSFSKLILEKFLE